MELSATGSAAAAQARLLMMLDSLDAETQAFLLDPSRLQKFAQRLGRERGTRIGQEFLWSAFAAVYDDLPSGPERRLWLLAVLEELAQRNEIILPVRHGKLWDRTSEI